MTFSCNKELVIEKLKEMKIPWKKAFVKEVRKEDLLDETKGG